MFQTALLVPRFGTEINGDGLIGILNRWSDKRSETYIDNSKLKHDIGRGYSKGVRDVQNGSIELTPKKLSSMKVLG